MCQQVSSARFVDTDCRGDFDADNWGGKKVMGGEFENLVQNCRRELPFVRRQCLLFPSPSAYLVCGIDGQL